MKLVFIFLTFVLLAAPAAAETCSSVTVTPIDDKSVSTNCVPVTPPVIPNEPPVAVNDTASGVAPALITGNVLTNDSDPDGGVLTVEQPNTEIAADGSFAITQDVAGTYTYNYVALDGQGGASGAVLTVEVAAPPPQPSGPAVAFPGAEGYGRNATGGRGGAVIQVTNLDDAGPGSLRACVEATGPRTCVFRVAGTISINTKLMVQGKLTIAGQTAPGQGIAIKNGQTLDKSFHFKSPNVIVRHIHVRPGPTVQPTDLINCFGIEADDIILDHVSCSWTTDQNMYAGPGDRWTVQDSLFYEGLERSTHTSAVHSKGTMFIGGGGSLIRNVIAANSDIRCPNIEGWQIKEYEFRNNISFNCRVGFVDLYNRSDTTTSTSDDTKLDAVGNVVIGGPETRASDGQQGQTQFRYIYPFDAYDRQNFYGPSRGTLFCLQDNLALGPTFRSDRLFGVLNPNDAHLVGSTDCYAQPVGRGMTAPALPSGQVEAYVLTNAGAFPKHRDSADTRITAEIALRQGQIIDHPDEVGGWPVLAAGTPYPDADGDGMDDGWEVAHGVTDPNADADNNGYTNLEEFLAELAASR